MWRDTRARDRPSWVAATVKEPARTTRTKLSMVRKRSIWLSVCRIFCNNIVQIERLPGANVKAYSGREPRRTGAKTGNRDAHERRNAPTRRARAAGRLACQCGRLRQRRRGADA